jgi:hypothetical protein
VTRPGDEATPDPVLDHTVLLLVLVGVRPPTPSFVCCPAVPRTTTPSVSA